MTQHRVLFNWLIEQYFKNIYGKELLDSLNQKNKSWFKSPCYSKNNNHWLQTMGSIICGFQILTRWVFPTVQLALCLIFSQDLLNRVQYLVQDHTIRSLSPGLLGETQKCTMAFPGQDAGWLLYSWASLVWHFVLHDDHPLDGYHLCDLCDSRPRDAYSILLLMNSNVASIVCFPNLLLFHPETYLAFILLLAWKWNSLWLEHSLSYITMFCILV